MRTILTLILGGMFTLGVTGIVMGQDNSAPPLTAKQELQRIHSPRSINEELDRLTKDLELTQEQIRAVRPLLQEHHDKIQALLDKNPNASRQALGPQIHAISDQTHHEIDALLTDHQKQLAKAMVERERNGQENRRPLRPVPSPNPSGANS
jgi:hypothetical protein